MHFRKKNREAYTNFLRAKYEAYTGATTVRSYPYYLLIDPADICNLRCPTCPTGIDNEDRRGKNTAALNRSNRAVMETELYDQLIEEIGPYLFHLMLYNWGEPLLNQSIGHFIRKAQAYDIVTGLHTNLSLKLSESRIEEILTSGLDNLTASIDGFSQEAYQIHRVGGNIDLVKRNLEALADARERLGARTNITYKMLVFGHNEHEIQEAKQYCQDIGVGFAYEDGVVPDPSWMTKARLKKLPKGLGFATPAQPGSEASFEPADASSDRQEIIASTSDPEASHANEREARLDVLYSEDRKAKGKHPSFCSWHYGYSVITAAGSVAPCCSTGKQSADFGEVIAGENQFADVWNNGHFRHARGVWAGQDTTDTADIETICEPCQFPKFVQQLYSIHDPRVIAAFHQQFGEIEPEMAEAFRLLSKKRYGFFKSRHIERGKITPKIMTGGTGNERKTRAFVDFFEKRLASEATAQDGAPA